MQRLFIVSGRVQSGHNQVVFTVTRPHRARVSFPTDIGRNSSAQHATFSGWPLRAPRLLALVLQRSHLPQESEVDVFSLEHCCTPLP
jgi:hypothetical protein